MNKKEFLRFIKYLYEGHSTMQYGIYFGSRKAENSNDFLKMIKKELKDHKNQKIIYYTEIDKLLDKIDQHQEYHNINNPLLYFNTNWQYGIKDKESYNYFYGAAFEHQRELYNNRTEEDMNMFIWGMITHYGHTDIKWLHEFYTDEILNQNIT